jgi:hypothetical protein
MEDAVSAEWRMSLGVARPSRLFLAATDALQRELPKPATIEGLRATAGRLHGSNEPAAVVTGTLIEVALEQRLFAEVRAGRLSPDAFAV